MLPASLYPCKSYPSPASIAVSYPRFNSVHFTNEYLLLDCVHALLLVRAVPVIEEL